MKQQRQAHDRVRARRTRVRSVGFLLVGLMAFAACTPTPTDPCATAISCGQKRNSAASGSGEKVLLIGDSILAAYGIPSGVTDTVGAPFAAARVAQNGLAARAFTSTGSSFEHWNRGLIRRDSQTSGPITDQSIADLNAGQNPATAHVVIALGTNDASYIANGQRSQQQVADQVLLAMNEALFTSTSCTIMVTPAVHGFSTVNPSIGTVRDVIGFVAAVKNNELGQNRVHVADFHQLWVDSGRPESWFQGPQNPHLSNEGFGRYLDLIFLYTAAAKNGSLGC